MGAGEMARESGEELQPQMCHKEWCVWESSIDKGSRRGGENSGEGRGVDNRGVARAMHPCERARGSQPGWPSAHNQQVRFVGESLHLDVIPARVGRSVSLLVVSRQPPASPAHPPRPPRREGARKEARHLASHQSIRSSALRNGSSPLATCTSPSYCWRVGSRFLGS